MHIYGCMLLSFQASTGFFGLFWDAYAYEKCVGETLLCDRGGDDESGL